MILQRRRAEHLVLLVGQRLRWRDDDAESPVWTPIGSKFSMLQIVMQVSAPSRITSYSISFQPSSERSTSTWWIGLASRPLVTIASSSAACRGDAAAGAAQRVGRADDQRQRHDLARTHALRRASVTICAVDDRLADRLQQLLEQLAVFGLPGSTRAACRAAARRSARGCPASASCTARLRPVWPPSVGSSPSGRSRSMTRRTTSDGQRLDVDRVGDVLVGHDRGRVGVDQDRADALLAQGLQACVPA